MILDLAGKVNKKFHTIRSFFWFAKQNTIELPSKTIDLLNKTIDLLSKTIDLLS